MLRLRKKICRHIPGICCLVRQNQNFAGAGNGINADISEHGLFSQSDINISGTDNLVHLGNALRAECQSGNRLCAPDLKHAVCARLPGGYQHRRINLSVSAAGRRHNNLVHTGNLCRHNVHQNRGRIGGLAAGNVDTGSLHGGHLLPQENSLRFGGNPAVLFLLFMKAPDIYQRFPDDLYQRGIHRLVGFLCLFLRYLYGFPCQLRVVKFLRIGKQSLVSSGRDIRNNLLYNRFLLAKLFRTAIQEFIPHFCLCLLI